MLALNYWNGSLSWSDFIRKCCYRITWTKITVHKVGRCSNKSSKLLGRLSDRSQDYMILSGSSMYHSKVSKVAIGAQPRPHTLVWGSYSRSQNHQVSQASRVRSCSIAKGWQMFTVITKSHADPHGGNSGRFRNIKAKLSAEGCLSTSQLKSVEISPRLTASLLKSRIRIRKKGYRLRDPLPSPKCIKELSATTLFGSLT